MSADCDREDCPVCGLNAGEQATVQGGSFAKCSTCFFGASHPQRDEGYEVQCRRHPVWQHVGFDHWCGDWIPRPGAGVPEIVMPDGVKRYPGLMDDPRFGGTDG